MRSAAAMVLGLTLAASQGGSALAIATLEDALRQAPRIHRTPSGMPPNNLIHRAPAMRRTPFQSGSGATGAPDQGPETDQPLVEVPATSVPWMVAIGDTEDLQNNFLCAGVLIHPNWVLTAAHCLFLTARRWPHDSRPLVFIGSPSLSEPGRSFPVIELINHPKYSPITLQNDVALVKFDPGGHTVTPIAMEGPPIREHVGDIGTILGFGASTSRVDQPQMGRPKLLQAAIVGDDICFSRTKYEGLRNTGVYCARPLVKHHDICHRFSGSPMVIYDSGGRLYVVGLVTWNTVCPLPEGRLNVFQDVQAKVPWIKSVIGGKPNMEP